MINVGIAGIGFMGMIHYLAYQKNVGVQVAALCEQDATRLAGDWRAIKGNFGPAGTLMDLSGIAKYAKLDDLVADPRLDLIDICLPPDAHARAAIDALAHGKHVFCEKPIALTSVDAREMVRKSREAGKLLMIGHVLPFFPEYTYAHEIARGGKYGRLLGGTFKRIISDPSWLPNFFDPTRIGGPMLDLHIHDAHFIRMLFGMPTAVTSGGRMRGDVAEFFSSQFQFADPALSVTATSGIIRQQGRSFTHGYEIHLEEATLLYDFAVINDRAELTMPVTLLSSSGEVTRPDLGTADPVDAFVAELREVLDAVAADQVSPVLDGQLACDALTLCEHQTASIRHRRTIAV